MIFLYYIKKYIFLTSLIKVVISVFRRGEPRLSIVSVSSKGSVSSRDTEISSLSRGSSLNSLRSQRFQNQRGSIISHRRSFLSMSRQNSRRGSDFSTGSNVALRNQRYRKGSNWFSHLAKRFRSLKFRRRKYSING
uniref:Secreted protein n=1 Tax=Strongyloides venezuelensis TaxID=75913 RepID=A0A0K0FR29_STRVS